MSRAPRDSELDQARFLFKVRCQVNGDCTGSCPPGSSCERMPSGLRPEAAPILRLANRARRLARDLRRKGYNTAADHMVNAIRWIEGAPS